MRTQRHLTFTTPIPSHTSPHAVVAGLKTVSPVMRHLGSLARYEMIPADPAATADDPFFDATVAATRDRPIVSFQIHELTTLVPGLTKELHYKAFFQPVVDGLRCRANAPAGVIVWSEFTVRERQVSTPSTGSEGSPGTMPMAMMEFADEFELHEAAVVEADSLLMPFVSRNLANLHQELCNKIVDEVVKNYASYE